MLRSKQCVFAQFMFYVNCLYPRLGDATDLCIPLVPLFFAPFFRPSSVSTGLMFKTNEHAYMIYVIECRQTNTGHCLLNETVGRNSPSVPFGHPDLLTNNQ